MENPLVSVCINTYNKEKYIRETLDSVFAQTYSPLEVVVVDDASTDRTLSILESYGDRLRLLRRSVNSDCCTITRNQAIRAATGRYIATLDADDFWYPEKIARQIAFMESHPAIPMCHTACHLIDENSNVIGIRHQGLIPPTGPCFRPFMKHCYVTISSTVYRRELLDEVGLMGEDKMNSVWGDAEYFLGIARNHDIGFIAEPLTAYRKHPENISKNRQDTWKYQPETPLILDLVLKKTALWRGVVSRTEVVQALIEAATENCEYWSHRGRPDRALYFLLFAQRRAPFNLSLAAEYIPVLGRALIHPFRRSARA